MIQRILERHQGDRINQIFVYPSYFPMIYLQEIIPNFGIQDSLQDRKALADKN